MHDSFEGLRSITGRNLIVEVDPFDETALVEHPDQFVRGCLTDERNQLECQRRSYVAMADANLSGDVICDIGSNLN